MIIMSMSPARAMDGSGPHYLTYAKRLPDGRLECEVCPRHCRLRANQHGFCFAYQADEHGLRQRTYGRASGLCIDPIEKKPLFHFLPGTPVLSFGTVGCNLACRFCQNWDISHARQLDRYLQPASPKAIATTAAAHHCRSVAYTYNDPVVFLDYAIDTAQACRQKGLANVAVTAGIIDGPARRDLFASMDAANVDLKSFRDDFYRKWCGQHLAPVLATLRHLVHESGAWLEITTLLIPGLNDSAAELHELCRFIHDELHPNVPLHFSAFQPDGRMQHLPATPMATLQRAHDIAKAVGLRFVYLGNVHDQQHDSTWCPDCGACLIGRDWYELTTWNLDPAGRCRQCQYQLPGRLASEPGNWGRKRLPVSPAPD